MAQERFAACLDEVLRHEGGYVDHPRDPGGATNMGITFAVLRQWRGRPITKGDVRALSKAEAGSIYAARYWRPVRGDDLPAGADLAVFDYAVNSGVGRASKHAQAVAGMPADQQDGAIGPVTLAAIRARDTAGFIKQLCARRLSFVRSLRIWSTFGKGWSRRIARVEALALSWVLTGPALEAEARDARGTAAGQATTGVATGAGGTALVPEATGLPWWFIALVAAAIAVPLVIRAIINLQRAHALAAVSKDAVAEPR